jgi:hypothetical protein
LVCFRWRQTIDKFWGNLCFFLFLVYVSSQGSRSVCFCWITQSLTCACGQPAVSIATLRPFNCDSSLGLLRDDYTVVCPPLHSPHAIFAAIFIVLYPLGIPLFLVGAMRYMHIHKIVKEKMDSAKVASMLALFMRRACSVECQRMARLVGNVDSKPEEFDRQTKSEFSELLALQGDTGSTTLMVDRLRSMQDSEGTHGMEGITMNELVSQKVKIFFDRSAPLQTCSSSSEKHLSDI